MSREIGSMPPQTYEHREGIRNGFRSQNELAAQHESFDKFESERLSSSESCHLGTSVERTAKDRSTNEILNCFIDGAVLQ